MEIGANDSTWGTKLNTTIELIESAISGRAAITHSDAASYTLTASNAADDEARKMVLNIGGALTAARNTVVPTQSKLYVAKNATTGGYATTLKTSAGTGISIPNGKTMLLMCDGTDVVDAIDYISSLTLGTALSPASGGTGVANNNAATLTRSGNHALTLTTTATTGVTLPTTGTLATLAGEETFTNKTVSGAFNGTVGATTPNTAVVTSLSASAAVLQTGTVTARFENSAASAPSGSAGVGVELGGIGGVATVFAYNRTTPAYAALDVRGDTVTVSTGSSPAVMATFDGGRMFIGDTANANMTQGLTINQGANDDNIIDLKSSDVSHPLTGIAEADTFGSLRKLSSTAGGLHVRGFGETGNGLALSGFVDTDTTSKTSSSRGAVEIYAYKEDLGNVGAMGSDANLLIIGNHTTTSFIFDAEGQGHSLVAWTTFDTLDDLQVLDGLDSEMQRRNGVQRAFGEWVGETRTILQREGIVHFYDDGPRAMFNWTKMHMLEVGAIRQLGRSHDSLRMEIGESFDRIDREIERLTRENVALLEACERRGITLH